MLFKGSNNLVQIYRSFSITGNYGRRSFSKYGISYYMNLLEIPPLRTFGSASAFYFIKTCTSSFITVAGEIRNKYRPVTDFVRVVKMLSSTGTRSIIYYINL
jgi:hypothetical protein